jgi:hypothetical protein
VINPKNYLVSDKLPVRIKFEREMIGINVCGGYVYPTPLICTCTELGRVEHGLK